MQNRGREHFLIILLVLGQDNADVETASLFQSSTSKTAQGIVIIEYLEGVARHAFHIAYFAEKAGLAVYVHFRQAACIG